METLKLSLSKKDVKIEDKNGNVKTYTVSEMTEKERDDYLQAIGSKMELDKAGTPKTMKDWRGLQSSLVSRCLRDENGEPVSEKEIKKYPAKTVSALYKIAQDLNAMSGLGKQQVKND